MFIFPLWGFRGRYLRLYLGVNVFVLLVYNGVFVHLMLWTQNVYVALVNFHTHTLTHIQCMHADFVCLLREILKLSTHNVTGVLPKSTNPAHIKENADVFGFELSDKDMLTLSRLSTSTHYCWDPSAVAWCVVCLPVCICTCACMHAYVCVHTCIYSVLVFAHVHVCISGLRCACVCLYGMCALH